MPEIRGKRARSRMIIMHAAKELFEEKGLNHVTFNDIATRADMCRTTIFNHFSTINELMLAVMEQEVNDVLSYCGDSRQEGEDLIRAMFEMLIDDTCNYPVLTAKLVANSIISAQERPSLAKLEKVIADNLPNMPDREKEQKVIQLTGIYYGLVNHYFINNYEFDRRKMKRKFNEMANSIL